MAKVPSKVTDMKFIRFPEKEKVVDSDDEWSRCGMWILINQTGEMSWIDEAWMKLQVLLKEGSLLMIKASTAAMPDEPGTILCYTRPGETEIEHAANEIRKNVHYEACMYYKINRLTEYKIDHRYGHKNINQYMHTFKGFFYKNGNVGEWILVKDTDYVERRRRKCSMAIYFVCDKNPLDGCIKIDRLDNSDINFDELPSRSKETFMEMKIESKTVDKKSTRRCISMTCRLDEIKDYFTEADKLWLAGKKLIWKGTIDKVTCEKKCNAAKFNFLFLDKLHYKCLIKICDKIYSASQVFQFMYIHIGNTKYRYSPEKELYKDYKFVALE